MSWNLSSNSNQFPQFGSLKSGRLTRGGISRSLWEPNPKIRKERTLFLFAIRNPVTAGFGRTNHLRALIMFLARAHVITSVRICFVQVDRCGMCMRTAYLDVLHRPLLEFKKNRQLLCAGATILHGLNVLQPLECRPEDNSLRPAIEEVA